MNTEKYKAAFAARIEARKQSVRETATRGTCPLCGSPIVSVDTVRGWYVCSLPSRICHDVAALADAIVQAADSGESPAVNCPIRDAVGK